MAERDNAFSAAEPALGYLYQLRFALLRIFQMPEETICLIEGDDDIDFTDPEEGRLLASLKHKAPGDTLTDLSPDFWKSVRIWLTAYIEKRPEMESASFFLFTTGSVSPGSFLATFLPGAKRDENLVERADEVLARTTSKTILKAKELFDKLAPAEKASFLARVTIFDAQERIGDIPSLIMEGMRSQRPQFRKGIFERLEGWWINEAIELMRGERTDPVRGTEVSEMLAFFSEQFREDSLPIDFEFEEPADGVHPDRDERLFVQQLRAIGLKSDRLRRAILDYYRAFEQRASWARENVVLTGEVERYDERLVEEWNRIREIVWEELEDETPEEVLQQMGRKLLNQLSTSDHENLRIRSRVTATFVAMGSYHMLANEMAPRVHWHPRFLERLTQVVTGGSR